MTAYTAHELIAEAEREGGLERIQELRDIDEVATQISRSVLQGRSMAFVTARSGVGEAMEARLRELGCPVGFAHSAEQVTTGLQGRAAAILWHQQLPVVPRTGAVLITDTSPGALLATWGVDEHDRDGTNPITTRFACGYLRKPFRMDHLFSTLDHLTA